MAEMNDRGQIILVAGVLIAVLFVALALLVNAAIYTDNVATRGGDSAGEILEYQAGAVDAVGGLIDAENAHGDDITVISDRVELGTEAIDDALAAAYLRRGIVARVDSESVETDRSRGLLIRETDANSFERWDANASAVRAFTIELDPAMMDSSDPPFRINLNATELEINKTTDEFVIRGGQRDVECTVHNGAPVTFDVTGERLGTEPCRFGWPELDSESHIGLSNADTGGGSYALTIRTGDSTAGLPDETTEALYSVNELAIRVETSEMSYETAVRVASGEPDVQ